MKWIIRTGIPGHPHREVTVGPFDDADTAKHWAVTNTPGEFWQLRTFVSPEEFEELSR